MSNEKAIDVANAVAESTTSDEKTTGVSTSPYLKTVEERDADVTLRLIEQHGHEFGPLTPEAEKKLKRKLYLHIMVLVSVINLVLFVSWISVIPFYWTFYSQKRNRLINLHSDMLQSLVFSRKRESQKPNIITSTHSSMLVCLTRL